MQVNLTFYIRCFFTVLISLAIFKVQAQNEYPNIVNTTRNYIEFNNLDLKPFIAKYHNNQSKFVIAHFGDSHIQPDYFTGYMRNALQKIKGNGGRGMIFPYSIAHTYSQADYKSSFKGKWSSANSIHNTPKIPLGISGFSASTLDTVASFKIVFNTSVPVNIISLFINNKNNNYATLLYDGLNILSPNATTISNNTTKLEFKVNHQIDSFEIRFNKTSLFPDSLIIRGLYLENNENGLIYNNLGVGGAPFEALLKQQYFSDEIKSINPDLFILDWGSNDIIYKNCIDNTLPEVIKNTILKVRSAIPNAVIVLTSVQDMNRKGVNITTSVQFSQLIRKLAFDNGCLFYDWFAISGGKGAMFNWVDNKLAREDNIHLTKIGYELKGKLFYNAFVNTIDSIKNNINLKTLKFDDPVSSFDSLYLRDCSKIINKPTKRIIVSKSRKSIKKKSKVVPKKKKITKPVKSTKKKSTKKKK
jgi:hypothetical protein